MMIAEDAMLPRWSWQGLKQMIVIFFGGLLDSDPVETMELGNLVALGIGATLVTLKLNLSCSSYILNTIGFVKF